MKAKVEKIEKKYSDPNSLPSSVRLISGSKDFSTIYPRDVHVTVYFKYSVLGNILLLGSN